MAVNPSVVLGIPGAFMASVQCLKLVKLGANFKEDLAIAAADLKICEIHLLRWGDAAGILDGSPEPVQGGMLDKLSEYSAQELEKAKAVLDQIVEIFNTTKQSSKFASFIDGGTHEGNTEGLDETEQLQLEQLSLNPTHKHLDKVRAKYSKAVDVIRRKVVETTDRTKWALYKKITLPIWWKECRN